jgi:hypothetical protein
MIYTSSYKNWNGGTYYCRSISGDRGKDANYEGECYPDLAPKKEFWRKWKNNRGIIPEEENNMYYIEEYYKQVLKELDVSKVFRELNNKTLLCYEDNMEFCHRHIVAAWFELLLNEDVQEVKSYYEGTQFKVEYLDKPKYIKEYLEIVIKKNKNMKGFNSLGALYLFEKGEKYEALANKLEKENGNCYDNYRQLACFLRCDADMAEEEYNAKNKQKVIKK